MSSSKKNWPSMFKSKPCNNHHHHDMDTPSYMQYSNCNTSPFSADRVPDPKPRWNPKPEQIRILESIFNSGMVNPPRDEIKKIRIRLQEFGQIGDANVFYWFQNRKSRAKHKLRVLQQKVPKISGLGPNKTNNHKEKNIAITNDDVNPCFGLVNQETGLFPGQNNELLITEPAGFPLPVYSDPRETQVGFGLVTEEEMRFNGVNNGVRLEIDETLTTIPAVNFYGGDNDGAGSCYSPIYVPVTVPLTVHQTQEERVTREIGLCVAAAGDVVLYGGGDAGDCVSPARLTVFINDMPFEVVAGLFNVREAFGNDAVLINSSGEPILTDEFGVTLQPLQNGAVYYLI